MVIYFTGTGNSRYLAELIAKQLNDELVNAPEHIQNEEYPAFASEKPYVFVCPTYAWRMPKVFCDWIRSCQFSGRKEAYFVLNCGSGIGAASIYAKQLCSDMGFDFMGMAKVIMPENYIAMFSAPSEEKTEKIVHKAERQIPEMVACIVNGVPFHQTKITPLDRFLSGIVNDNFYKHSIKADKFYATDKCIACGKCVSACMLNNIIIDNDKPAWGDHCTHCMACICGCPMEAIEYGKHTVGLRRYMMTRSAAETEDK